MGIRRVQGLCLKGLNPLKALYLWRTARVTVPFLPTVCAATLDETNRELYSPELHEYTVQRLTAFV